MSNYL